jgi:hypothetical protein
VNKLAKSALGARAIEGLLGATIGSGLGAAGASIFHEPAKAREWTDENGQIQGRPLTREETSAKRQLVARVALLGAVGGASASLGTSALLGRRIAAAERSAAKRIAEGYLTPMRGVIEKYKGLHATVAGSPGGVGGKSQAAKNLLARVNKANELLGEQEKAIQGLLGAAEKRRAQVPFRGAVRPRTPRKGYDPSQLSHVGMVDQHFDDFAKAHGYGGIRVDATGNPNPMAPFDIFNDAVEKAMTKTSQAAFAHELHKIALSKGQRRYRAKSGDYFGGEKKLQISKEEMSSYKKRLAQAGIRNSISGSYSNLPDSLKKTVKGFSAHTHRARTNWYPSPEAIPLAKLKFIASTG